MHDQEFILFSVSLPVTHGRLKVMLLVGYVMLVAAYFM